MSLNFLPTKCTHCEHQGMSLESLKFSSETVHRVGKCIQHPRRNGFDLESLKLFENLILLWIFS